MWFGTIALWGVIQDIPDIRPSLPIETVKDWDVACFNRLVPCYVPYDMDGTDEAAELMVGGPLQGFATIHDSLRMLCSDRKPGLILCTFHIPM